MVCIGLQIGLQVFGRGQRLCGLCSCAFHRVSITTAFGWRGAANHRKTPPNREGSRKRWSCLTKASFSACCEKWRWWFDCRSTRTSSTWLVNCPTLFCSTRTCLKTSRHSATKWTRSCPLRLSGCRWSTRPPTAGSVPPSRLLDPWFDPCWCVADLVHLVGEHGVREGTELRRSVCVSFVGLRPEVHRVRLHFLHPAHQGQLHLILRILFVYRLTIGNLNTSIVCFKQIFSTTRENRVQIKMISTILFL